MRTAAAVRSRGGEAPLQEMNLVWSCVMALVPKPCSKLSGDSISEGKEVMRGREEVKRGASFSGVVQVKQVKYLRVFIKPICCLERKKNAGLEH